MSPVSGNSSSSSLWAIGYEPIAHPMPEMSGKGTTERERSERVNVWRERECVGEIPSVCIRVRYIMYGRERERETY